MTAEEFVERHGPVILKWLQANTVECACSTPFGPDESLQRGTIDLTYNITYRTARGLTHLRYSGTRTREALSTMVGCPCHDARVSI